MFNVWKRASQKFLKMSPLMFHGRKSHAYIKHHIKLMEISVQHVVCYVGYRDSILHVYTSREWWPCVCVCLPQRQLLPRSIYRSCPAATRNTWELFGAPHDGSNSEVSPCPTPPPLFIQAVGAEQANPIDLKISIRRGKNKTNRLSKKKRQTNATAKFAS